MATPVTGPISAADLRSEVKRTGSGSVDFAEMRTRYDTTGALSFNELRGAESFTITCGANSISIKSSTTNATGWSQFPEAGSVSPNESTNQNPTFDAILLAGNSSSNTWIASVQSSNSTSGANSTPTRNQIFFDDDVNGANSGAPGVIADPNNFQPGLTPADMTRIVIDNNARNIVEVLATSVEFDGAFLPSSGTLSVFVAF